MGDLHQHPWRSVVLQDDLVDDARPRSPELDTIFLSSTFQEVKDLLVGNNGTLEDIGLCAKRLS
jgi:hypothetical protein